MGEIIIDILLWAAAAAAFVFGIIDSKRESRKMTKKQSKMLRRIAIAAMGAAVLQLISAEAFSGMDRYLFPSAGRWLRLVLYLAVYAVIGYDIVKKAVRGIGNRRIFDENFLMTVATLGALSLAIYENGDYLEAVAVMLFYQIGEWFQSYAVGKSRRSIGEMMDIRPDRANVERGGSIEAIAPDEVKIGETIIVRPGEKIPIDGIVTEGKSSLDTSALTGESLPRSTAVGDEVISGCINLSGVLKIKTTKNFGESTVSKILDLVENASSRKSKSENFISEFAKIYTPAVCGCALALAVLPPVVRGTFLGLPAEWEVWLYRALTFLVISCPCALVISIPLSFFAGIGGASREGILVKGSNFLEVLSKVRCVVFDKTGTLTRGVFEVNAIHHSKLEEQRLLEYAALAESASPHPISKSLRRAYGGELDTRRVTDIREISGCGVIAKVDGNDVAAGNDKLMKSLGVPFIGCHKTGTIVHMAVGGEYMGHIVISDVIKPTSRAAIDGLTAAGVRKTVMLTGDAASAASQTAEALGVDEVYSELLPADKVEKVEELLDTLHGKEKLAFVGDGINDAPVLSRADIGIAMGAMGSDAAIEAADVVLMDDDPLKIVKAIKISVKCLKIVRQNIVIALGIKLVCLLLGAVGAAGMYLAVFADVGVMIIAVLNAIRCLFVKNL